MGVTEDINWLKDDEEGVGKVFLLIAKGSARLRELQELFGVEDWWPVKSHLRALIDRRLVTEIEGNYKLTENGQKVLEGRRAMEHVEPV
jgi:predicted transcriptional regulator